MNKEEKKLIVENLAHYMRLMVDRSGCFKGETLLGKPLHSGVICCSWLVIHLLNGKSIELCNQSKLSTTEHKYCGDTINVNTSFDVSENDSTTNKEENTMDIMELDPVFYADAVSIDVSYFKHWLGKYMKGNSHIPLSSIAWIDFLEDYEEEK